MAESPPELSAQIEHDCEPSIVFRKFSTTLLHLRASTVESPEELSSQLKFIEDLAPYYRLARFRHEDHDFIERLFDLWFIRWRLKLQDYEGSIGSLNDGIWQKKQWIKGQLSLAASSAGEEHLERSWQMYMTICERRQGVSAKKRKYREYDGHEDAPRPLPRPKPKKVRTGSSNCINTIPSSDDRIGMIPTSDDCIDVIPK